MAPRRRNWVSARAKVDLEGACRVCGAVDGLEAAHIIGRVHDPDDGKVRPVDVVPLCGPCHRAYDGRALDILPVLTLQEQAAAVGHVGLVSAYQRTTSSRLPANSDNFTHALGGTD